VSTRAHLKFLTKDMPEFFDEVRTLLK